MADEGLLTLETRDLAVELPWHTREFWTNELEVRYDQLREQASQVGFLDEWIEKRNGRQIDVLRSILGIEGARRERLKEKKAGLKADDDELFHYVLVQEFAKFKSKLATIGVAQRFLPPDIVDLCRKGQDDEDEDYDTLALCFAIFHHVPPELPSILHMDRVHKTGFARMKMKDGPRRPKEPLADFLTANVVEGVLSRFDRSKGDGRTSEFKRL